MPRLIQLHFNPFDMIYVSKTQKLIRSIESNRINILLLFIPGQSSFEKHVLPSEPGLG
ncbi:hypothetical protein MCGE09_00301 [Thaumarchaeota archaeon SCGC AB-539-E09]|nr:hypothetical protein MCGE09_00301 [Thaumarchaeota archaeon SCGC AB-539-E09]